MNEQQIATIVERQRSYFMTHATMDVAARKAALDRLLAAVHAHEDDIARALHEDLGKSFDESYMCEIGLSLSEIRYQRAHLARWARPRLRPTDLANAIATSRVERVPYGVTLVMAPWNYPFLLTLEPLAGALAAGNTVVVKPSAYAPASSAVLAAICAEAFSPELVSVVEGGRAENEALLDQRWDNIFFTGSVAVGRLVMQRAAAHLTPVTLELGGKSPCIVEASANLAVAARRIAFGKWLNVGQTCVAPDYLLVDRNIKDELIELVRAEATKMYGDDALANPAFGKMINEKHFRRVLGLIEPAKVVMGGGSDAATLRSRAHHHGRRRTRRRRDERGDLWPRAARHRLRRPRRGPALRGAAPTPLALYLFTQDRTLARRVMRGVAFGGGCVNDTIMHLATSHMGFGGMGNSGMGSYHGRKSFEAFTHEKSVVSKATFFDAPFRYQPYTSWKRFFVRKFVH